MKSAHSVTLVTTEKFDCRCMFLNIARVIRRGFLQKGARMEGG
jgi:hypothetical protein